METLDLEQTRKLVELAAAPQHLRNDIWSGKFLRSAANASLAALTPQIEDGPDRFPYFQLALPDPGSFAPVSIVAILDQVLQAGAGAVIHANVRRDQQPLWVFSFGDILSYAMFQDFAGDPGLLAKPDPPANPQDRNLLRASPSESYLPASARAAIGRFIRGPLRHPNPKIGVVTGAALRPRQSLMVNLRLKDYRGDRNKLASAMRYLAWFIPKTYSVMPLPDDWSDEGMAPL